MSKIIKITDEEMDHPLDYRITDSGRGNDIKRFVPEPGTNNLDNATPVDRNLLEQIQKNGVYEVETVHTVNSSSVDIYNCEIEGLNDFGVYKKLLIKMLVDMPNEFNQPKLKLNDIEYTMLYKPENEDFKPLDAGMLKAGQFYNLVFNGSQFVVENGSLPATLKSAGNISLEGIRGNEIAYVLGTEYGGMFGSSLTSIEKGKVYYYYDTVRKFYTPYEALNTATKSGGFITPDVANFVNLNVKNMVYEMKNNSDFLLYLDRQTLILHLMKKNILESTLEYVTSQIISFINNNDYTILPGTPLGNFNVVLRNDTSKVYNAYGIFQNISAGIAFFFGESNTRIDNNASYYFHSGEMKVKMEAK